MHMHTMRLDARPGHEEQLAAVLSSLVEELESDGTAVVMVGQVSWARGEFFLVETYEDPQAVPLQQRPDLASKLLEHVESSFRYVESAVIASAGIRQLATGDMRL